MLFGHAVEAMTAADAVLVASGTASLEAALLKRPMVISYRMGSLRYRLMKRLAYLPWVGLPNILCGEEMVPELLQDDATPERLAAALEAWFDDVDRRHALETVSWPCTSSCARAPRRKPRRRSCISRTAPTSRSNMICGVDEAGRGPLCGSVVAAAVILDPHARLRGWPIQKLSERQRERLAALIRSQALAWSVAEACVEEIDRLNILHATMLAMKRAVEGLAITPLEALVDGNRCRRFRYRHGRSSRAMHSSPYLGRVDSGQDHQGRTADAFARPSLPAIWLCGAQRVSDRRTPCRAETLLACRYIDAASRRCATSWLATAVGGG